MIDPGSPSDVGAAATIGGLRVHARRPHLLVWLALPFGLIVAFFGGYVILTQELGVMLTIVAIGLLAFAGLVFASCAYATWGWVDIARTDERWEITKGLRRWRSTRSFRRADVLLVEVHRFSDDVAPHSGAPYITVQVHRVDLPVVVGAGLSPDRETLEALRSLFETDRQALTSAKPS